MADAICSDWGIFIPSLSPSISRMKIDMTANETLESEIARQIISLGGLRSGQEKRESVSESIDRIISGVRQNLKRLDQEKGWAEMLGLTSEKLAGLIDHTRLSADASAADIERHCAEAREYGFYAVCVNSSNIRKCRASLKGYDIKICTVAGFPLGANLTSVKVAEARNGESEGADEIDMVINIGALKDGDLSYVYDDICSVVEAVSDQVVIKVILENCYLTSEEKIKGCLLARMAGADFVKTSTGFGQSGATLEDVALMRFAVGNSMGVKAAGGIKDTMTALKLVSAGANRIGSSGSAKLVSGIADI